ncbi:protein SQS1-like [Lycium barbarum]|uniref:protein SQS1-like n=1 Tax=Lycium barbarum TaxID=112863 RepID=UPI00293EBA34|nr:protein SQS1-like [Lycium barbarum]
MANQGEQETRTPGETAEMLRDKVLQMEKNLKEIGRKIEEVIESNPQEESEPQQDASEPIEKEELEEGEPQNMEEEEVGPIDVEAEGDEEPFGMFPEFAEEENDANEESDYYAPTNERSYFYAFSPMLVFSTSIMAS